MGWRQLDVFRFSIRTTIQGLLTAPRIGAKEGYINYVRRIVRGSFPWVPVVSHLHYTMVVISGIMMRSWR